MKMKGVTIVELLIVISILMILTGVVVPGFSSLQQSIESQATVNEWKQFLSFGRSTSILQQSIIIACPIQQNHCSKDLNNQWVMFIDNNNNRIIDENESIIKTLNPDAKSRFHFYPENRTYFRFSDKPAGVFSGLMASISICPFGKADKYSSHIKININGRIATSKKTDAAGIPMRKSDGSWESIHCFD